MSTNAKCIEGYNIQKQIQIRSTKVLVSTARNEDEEDDDVTTC